MIKICSIIFIVSFILPIHFSKKEFDILKEDESSEEIIVNGDNELEHKINEGKSYVFTIENENHFYCFTALIDNIFFIKKENDIYEKVPNGTFFGTGEQVYVNHLKNLNDSKIKISPVNIYTELNSFETINENQYFFIKSENKAIAYFDSFDKNSKIYISESRQKAVLENDKRIDGKFQEIEPNSIYLIKNRIFYISVFKKYFYPLIENETVLDIEADDKNFFYLGQNAEYTLNFKENSMNKMIKLSTKTLNSKVKVIKNEIEVIELNRDDPYYILDKKFVGQLKLKVEESNAFIELLFNHGDIEILTEEKKEETKINKNTEIIKLPFTQKSFGINIKSNKIFNYSLSFGLTNKEEYFYSSSSNLKINSQKEEETLIYLSLFKNINLLKDEFLSITINLEKDENQEIFISYKQFSELDELIDEKMEPETCRQITKLLQELFESYIYVDIAQNPPDIGIPNYHHRKINLIEELGNISFENRKFYEFYQEIESVLCAVKDGHLAINAVETPSGIQFFEYWAIIPFRYIVRDYKGNKRVFITIREDYINFYDNHTQNFIRSHLEIPIKTINDQDPIDYIQNWSPFVVVKNINSKFTHNLRYLPGFYLFFSPLNYSEFMQNEYEFDDNKILRISYYIGKPEIKNEQFKNLFIETLRKYKNIRYLPPLEEIKNKFLHKKKLKNKENNEEKKIDWDKHYEEDKNFIKCRVDNKNEVNVFVQNTFNLEYEIAAGQIFQCAELFHSNKYPIILIEDTNNGGYPSLSYLMIQLFQMREVERTYSAVRYSDNIVKYFNIENEYGKDNIYDPDTCKTINSFDEFNETIDFYNYSGLNITHKRTNVFVELNSLNERKALNEFRKKYENSPNLKRPTDIIVFTDGYAFSSGSTFIKGLQNIGGAIIVGYSGNPKIEKDLFDASQSDSGVFYFDDSEISKNLEKLGFIIYCFTIIEVFDDSYKSPNPIPREYTMIPVDYRVDIYSQYSDDIYDDFIKEGKKIHKEFNENNYCNFNNKKLLLHDDINCKEIEKLEHAHGGYQCGENNQWNISHCVPYYCDIGYSFDQHLKKCVEDCMVDWTVYYIFQDNFTNTYTIKKDEKLEFITLNPNQFIYVFESSENYIEGYPPICFIKGYQDIVINNNKTSTNDIIVKINTINSDMNIMNFKGEKLLFDKLLFFKEKKMLAFQSNQEHALLFNNKINKIKYLKYNSSIKYQDIIDINDVYFQDYLEDLFILEKEEIYFIYYNHNIDEQTHVSINPVDSDEIFSLKEKNINYLYLKKGNTYSIEFPDSIQDIMIKLSRKTSNSEISFEDNKILLNYDNLYYLYKNNNRNTTLKLKIKNNDAIIEFLYNLTNNNIIENINFEKSEIKIKNEINIIKIPKRYKNITIDIKSEYEVQYSIFQGYSIPPFSHNTEVDEKDRMTSNNYHIDIPDPYNEQIKIIDNEYYIVMIRLFEGELDVYLNGEKETESEDENGLEWYEILLIVLGSIIFIIVIILIFIYIRRHKKGDSFEKIEDKMQNLTEI